MALTLLSLHVFVMKSKTGEPVLVAGDPERSHAKKVEKDGGIYYHVNLLAAMVSKY